MRALRGLFVLAAADVEFFYVLMSGTGFVAPADLPVSEDEDEQATDALA